MARICSNCFSEYEGAGIGSNCSAFVGITHIRKFQIVIFVSLEESEGDCLTLSLCGAKVLPSQREEKQNDV